MERPNNIYISASDGKNIHSFSQLLIFTNDLLIYWFSFGGCTRLTWLYASDILNIDLEEGGTYKKKKWSGTDYWVNYMPGKLHCATFVNQQFVLAGQDAKRHKLSTCLSLYLQNTFSHHSEVWKWKTSLLFASFTVAGKCWWKHWKLIE